MNLLVFNIAGHGGETHSGGGETLGHYLATDWGILLVGAAIWLVLLTVSAHLVRPHHRPAAGVIFGLVNVFSTVLLGTNYFFASLIFLSAGFGLVFYNLFKHKVCLLGLLLPRKKTKGGDE